MNDDDIKTHGASEPVDLTGTPAHETLREYWAARQEVGRRRTARAKQVTGDIEGNIRHTIAERNRQLDDHYEVKATRAWELYQAGKENGLTREQAAKEVGMSWPAVRRRWLAKGWMTR